MLYTLVFSVALITQFKMDNIVNERPMIKSATVIVQGKIVIKKVYVFTDKFGVDHENENREIARKSVEQENLKPFQMKDAAGEVWEHQNKDILENWIRQRNSYFSQTPVVTPNTSYNIQTFPLNCAVGTA